MTKWILLFTAFYTSSSFAALAPYEKTVSKGKVTFFKEVTDTPEQFSNRSYQYKPDQTWVESSAPLTKSMRMALSPEDFKTMTQEELDQIYIRLNSGPIAPGSYKGSVMMKGFVANNVKNFLLKKFHGVQIVGGTVCLKKDIFECFTEFAWEGKRIYPADPATGEIQMRNAVSKVTAHALKAALNPMIANLDPTNWLIRTVSPFYGEMKYMLFPAHVYCAQSLFDHRRESIVADYAWGSDFSPFIKGIDNIFGREHFGMREEIRMVRPGLYLGRVYAQKIFLFNFVLHNPDADKSAAEATWPADSCFSGKVTR
jgi:hypothetical protein